MNLLKRGIIVLLSILIVTTPFVSAFSRTEKTEKYDGSKIPLSEKLFQIISDKGGEELNDEQLAKEKGTGLLSWAASVIGGAVGGAITGIGVYGVGNWGRKLPPCCNGEKI